MRLLSVSLSLSLSLSLFVCRRRRRRKQTKKKKKKKKRDAGVVVVVVVLGGAVPVETVRRLVPGSGEVLETIRGADSETGIGRPAGNRADAAEIPLPELLEERANLGER